MSDFLRVAEIVYGADIRAAVDGADELRRLERSGVTAPSTLRDFAFDLAVKRLDLLLLRIGVAELHSYRAEQSLPVDPDSDAAWKGFSALLGPRTARRWHDKYAALEGKVHVLIGNVVDHAVEVGQRLNQDVTELTQFFGFETGMLHLEDLGSDPHDGGRAAVLLKNASGERLAYKPRDGSSEVAALDMFRVLGDDLGVDLTRLVPRTLAHPGAEYLWQEWVAQEPLHRLENAGEYYRKFGIAAALFAALGTTDLHHENVIARSSDPCFIDLETLMQPQRTLDRSSTVSALRDSVKTSVVNTLILPQRAPRGPYSTILCGLGVGQEQVSERVDYVVVNPASDAYDIRRELYRFQHVANVPTHGGENHGVEGHGDVFLDGYRLGREAVARRRDELVAIIEKPLKLRVILRATSVYGTFLQAAWQPDRIVDDTHFTSTLRTLTDTSVTLEPRADKYIGRRELASLAAADVPAFRMQADSVRLDGPPGPPITVTSPVEHARRGIQAATCSRVQAKEEVFIDRSFAELRRMPGTTSAVPPLADRHVFERWITSGDRDAANLLDAVWTLHEDADNGVAWHTGASPETLGTLDGGLAVSWHDYGIQVPFRRYASTTLASPDRRRADLAEQGFDQLRTYHWPLLEECDASILSGTASGYFQDVQTPRGRSRLKAHLANIDYSVTTEGDWGTSSASSLLAALHLDLLDADAREAVGDSLTCHLNAGRVSTSELVHGALGMEWCLYRLRHDTQRAAARERLLAAVSTPSPSGPGAHDASWCAGVAGRAIVALDVVKDLDRRLLHDWVELLAQIAPDVPVDISVCHGVGGRLQALVALHLAGTPGALSAAVRLRRSALDAILKQGYASGSPAARTTLGYFLGWAGFCDSLLILDEALSGATPWIPLTLTPPGAAA